MVAIVSQLRRRGEGAALGMAEVKRDDRGLAERPRASIQQPETTDCLIVDF